MKIYEDAETLGIFQDGISMAAEMSGSVMMAEPELYLEVVYRNGDEKEYHLWVGEDDLISSLINIEDTTTLYMTSKQFKNQLLELIK